jgi:serine/threonine protein kinase
MESQRIAGRYLVLRAVGRGGMGVVWLCRDEILGREVAVKQIGGLPGEPEVETMRAMREARSAAALNHPNVVAVYDVVNHDGRPWLVMEYVDGQTLAEILADEGRLPPRQVAGIGALLADALNRAHERGIVHRDIKPGNVLVDRSGRPKVSDFGIARGHGDDQLTQTGFVSGTPGYLSPELARGGDPDPTSDVWALGATLYVAVEGQPPYEGRSNPLALLRAIATEPPRPMQHAGALAPAIATMMDQDPARRWDMATAAQRLGEISRGDTSLLEDTQAAATRGDATQVLTTTAPLEATQRMALPPTGPAPEAASPVAAEARPSPRAARAAAATPPTGGPPPSAPPSASSRPGERGRRRWVPVVLVLVLLVALGGAYLLSQMNQDPSGPGTGSPAGTGTPTVSRRNAQTPSRSTTPSTTSTPSNTTPSSTLPTTTSPSSSAPTTSTPSSTAPTSATPSTSASSAAAGVAGGDRALASFVTSYFADVTKDRDRTWRLLTPTMHSAAGGRGGYDGFWRSIASVRTARTRADADNKVVDVTLTYTRDDGTTSTEQHRLTFVTKDGGYLIDGDSRVD